MRSKILSPWDISTAISPMTGISEKRIQVIHKIVRKIRKRADNQYEVSAIFTMRLENFCECGARVLQIKIMGAFFGVN